MNFCPKSPGLFNSTSPSRFAYIGPYCVEGAAIPRTGSPISIANSSANAHIDAGRTFIRYLPLLSYFPRETLAFRPAALALEDEEDVKPSLAAGVRQLPPGPVRAGRHR